MSRYQISHRTHYSFAEDVSLCHNELRLRPAAFAHQECVRSQVEVRPSPALQSERSDIFGNRVTYFSIQENHRELDIHAVNEIEVESRSYPDPARTRPWEEARRMIGEPGTPSELDRHAYILDSPFVMRSRELAEFALPSFSAGRPILEALQELMSRIYREFKYTPGHTTLHTPLAKILRERKGVCQDFTHIAIGALRSLNLPARYVSGYIETRPATGTLVGADASHAWFSVFVPEFGWMDFDPTNNHMPRDQHIVVAIGRDYGDVTPIKGVSMGGGKQTMKVSVEVTRLAS